MLVIPHPASLEIWELRLTFLDAFEQIKKGLLGAIESGDRLHLSHPPFAGYIEPPGAHLAQIPVVEEVRTGAEHSSVEQVFVLVVEAQSGEYSLPPGAAVGKPQKSHPSGSSPVCVLSMGLRAIAFVTAYEIKPRPEHICNSRILAEIADFVHVSHSRFDEQKSWSDGHIDEVNRVVRKVVGKIIDIIPTDPERDRLEGIDYDIKVAVGTIACRIRRAGYRYRDLTMTSHKISGVRTETEKILSGSVGWYLYAWAADGRFREWMFLDLDKLRVSGLIQTAIRDGDEKNDASGNSFIFIPFQRLLAHGVVIEHEMHPHRLRDIS
jgi:hypothetical protein